MRVQKVLRLAVWLAEAGVPGVEAEAFAGDLLELAAAGRSEWWCLAQALRRGLFLRAQRLRSSLVPFLFSAGFVLLYPLWQSAYTPLVDRLLARYAGVLQWPGSAALEVVASLLPAMFFISVGVVVYICLGRQNMRPSPTAAIMALNVGALLLLCGSMLRVHAMANGLGVLSRADFYYPLLHSRFSLLLLLSLFGSVAALPRRRTPTTRTAGMRLLSRRSLLRVARVFGLYAVLVPQVFAQAMQPQAVSRPLDANGRPIEFDVVSIRPNHSGAVPMDILSDPMSDTLTITNMPPAKIIEWAFLIFLNDEIVGMPEWARQDRYDIRAKVSAADLPSYRKVIDPIQRTPMLQKILIDRFGLNSHFETKELSVYALTVAKTGARLTEIQPAVGPNGMTEGGGRQRGRGRYQSMGQPMRPFINELTEQLKTPVVDRTGLTGFYNYSLRWTPDDGTPAEDDAPGLFKALQEQLGLKLERVKAPVQVLVIDHLERPSSN